MGKKNVTGHGFGLMLIGALMILFWFVFGAILINCLYMVDNIEMVSETNIDETTNPIGAIFAEMIMAMIMPTINVEIGIALFLPQIIVAGLALILALIFTVIYLVKVIQ